MTPTSLPLVEPLTEEALAAVHDQAMRILEEIGTRVEDAQARDLLRAQGLRLEGDLVRWDRQFVAEMVARAPSSFTLRPRNPERAVMLGGGSLVHAPSGGSPFVADLERGRRSGTIRDHVELVKLAHAVRQLRCLQSGTVEASDLSEKSRHLDMDYSILRWSDKPYVCYGTTGERARDAIELAAIACGGHAAIQETPAILGVVNPNSPLVWDASMVQALSAWAEAGQGILVTPFLLAGVTSPVSVAAGLSIQIAEALSGVALAQMVRPGTPCLFGSFYATVDMRTAGPTFGGPESVLATLAGGQLARRYGLPYRGGGGFCAANAVDAQAAAETTMSLWATHLAGSDFVLHAAGWLEGGLVTSLEKLVFDVEILRMFEGLSRGIPAGDEELAFAAIRDEGPGSMFLATDHTVAHYREWLYASPLFRNQEYTGWRKGGAQTADRVATTVWKQTLESYEDPGIDEGVDEALRQYIAHRKRELDR
jgi:trimethylamine--corrinoid protein Co-methyltransferase